MASEPRGLDIKTALGIEIPGHLNVFLFSSSLSCGYLRSHGSVTPSRGLSQPLPLQACHSPGLCKESLQSSLQAASPPSAPALLGLPWGNFCLFWRAPRYPFSPGTPPRHTLLGARVWRQRAVVQAPAGQPWSLQISVSSSLGRKNQVTPGISDHRRCPGIGVHSALQGGV